MIAKIEFEMILVKGEKMYKIIDIAGVLSQNELPTEYLEDGSCNFYGYANGFSTPNGNYYVGTTMDLVELNDLLAHLKKSGERLTKINRKIKELEKTHTGTFIYTV